MMKDRRCLVTGGARGLGKAICACFAEEGVHVAIGYRSNSELAQNEAKRLRDEYGVRAVAVGGEIGKQSDVKRIFEETIDAFSGIDFLVNNAGICPTSMVEDMSLQEWDDVIGANLTGTFLVCREMVRHLRKDKRAGSIVNIASQSAINGSTNGKTHYAASKGGVLSFTHSLAMEVSKYGIRVNSLSPGVVYTEMTADKSEADIARYEQSIPIGRIASAEEVARGAVFLCSSAADYITGANLDLSGGMIGR